MAKRMTGGQAVVRALAEHGVEVAFGIPGVHTLALYDALIDSPIRHILGRHEQGVGFMADGYARASGKPGVALVITGPGVTNVATAVGEAYTDSSPVLVVASAEDQRWAGKMMGHYHDIRDQTEAIRPVTASQAQATAVGEVAPAIGAAFARMASARPRPAYVEIPRDVLEAEAEITFPDPILVERPGPDAEQIAAACEEIARARRIVIIAGGGAVACDAGAAIVALAERLGAPVITSQMGKGIIPEDHPYALGNLWLPGNPVDALLRKADLALVFGTKLGGAETEDGAMRLPATVVRVDIDPEEVERNYRPTRAIVADARKTAAALDVALASAGISTTGWSAEEVAKTRTAALENQFGAENAAHLAALRRAIPRDGILVNDTTMMTYAAAKHYPVYAPRTFLIPAGYLTLGFSMPAAIGAKIAQPDKVVVSIVGDGGFQFTMHELATAKQFKIGLPIVIFNDSTYTAVKMEQAMQYDRRYLAVDLENPDFVKLAAAYGIPGVRANSPDELESAVVEASGRDLPTIIDVPIGWSY
ncbi:MAG: thiamine pyrophosphate protein binding domain protein [Thermomicrobiales bacterium]|nr:thiamine pyrophosphate protein binding domain protein [Thermomicrobiales bacterium]